MKEPTLLFHLLRYELWGQPLPSGLQMPTDLFKNVMELARVQAVDGLAVHALMMNQVALDRYEAAQAFALSGSVAQGNERLNSEVRDLCLLLSAHSVRFFLVKGQTIAALYPAPETRMSGDIDFYVYPDDFDRATEIIRREWDVELGTDDEGEQHLHFERHGVLFEMHYNLMHFSSKKVQKAFDAMVRDTLLGTRRIGDVEAPVLEDRLNLVYTFLHLYHHLIEVGVGLRQFFDLAILMKAMEMTPEDKREITSMLNRLGYTKAFYAIEGILADFLGLPEEKLLAPKDAVSLPLRQVIMRIVARGGNFGNHGRKHGVRSGWRYNMEMFDVKVRNHCRLFRLSPRENFAFLVQTLPSKIFFMLKR